MTYLILFLPYLVFSVYNIFLCHFFILQVLFTRIYFLFPLCFFLLVWKCYVIFLFFQKFNHIYSFIDVYIRICKHIYHNPLLKYKLFIDFFQNVTRKMLYFNYRLKTAYQTLLLLIF